MKETMDCKYLTDASHGMYKVGKCKITNGVCGYIRYCVQKNKIVSSQLFFLHGCEVKNRYEEGDM